MNIECWRFFESECQFSKYSKKNSRSGSASAVTFPADSPPLRRVCTCAYVCVCVWPQLQMTDTNNSHWCVFMLGCQDFTCAMGLRWPWGASHDHKLENTNANHNTWMKMWLVISIFCVLWFTFVFCVFFFNDRLFMFLCYSCLCLATCICVVQFSFMFCDSRIAIGICALWLAIYICVLRLVFCSLHWCFAICICVLWLVFYFCVLWLICRKLYLYFASGNGYVHLCFVIYLSYLCFCIVTWFLPFVFVFCNLHLCFVICTSRPQ